MLENKWEMATKVKSQNICCEKAARICCVTVQTHRTCRSHLPLSPGTAAIHMILAEQTAIQASTVGSSLMFNRHTWGGKNISTTSVEVRGNAYRHLQVPIGQ